MTDETGWLIERQPTNGMPEWLGISGFYNGATGGGEFTWTKNASNALRFSRHEDAAKLAGALIDLSYNQRHRDTLSGLRSGDAWPIVTDHAWVGP
jgi:hypothetical protein